MEQYTIYCTAEQTKKALELGASIHTTTTDLFNNTWMKVTAEQMIGWLEGRFNMRFSVCANQLCTEYEFFIRNLPYSPKGTYISAFEIPSRPEATLAAIDAALDYLIKKEE